MAFYLFSLPEVNGCTNRVLVPFEKVERLALETTRRMRVPPK
jgi:hypothetical protein